MRKLLPQLGVAADIVQAARRPSGGWHKCGKPGPRNLQRLGIQCRQRTAWFVRAGPQRDWRVPALPVRVLPAPQAAASSVIMLSG